MLNENVTFYFYVKVILLRLCMHFGGGGVLGYFLHSFVLHKLYSEERQFSWYK